MKHIERFFVFLILCALLISTAHAEGDPNIGSGGGGMGSGSGSCYWNPGWDGIRVTVVKTDGTRSSSSIDLTNKSIPDSAINFGKVDKLEYKSSLNLTPDTGNYAYIAPPAPLPTIISSSGGNSIEAIKSYFTDTGHLQWISDHVGLSYDDLIGGQYKLLIEPIAYFTYNDVFYAMTATEAALFDVMTSHGLRYSMPSLTHKNLPLSLFLEKDDWDIGITAWRDGTTGIQSNVDIINYLGVGVVSFAAVVVAPDPPADYIYHTNTDVITAIAFTNTWGDITPNNPAWMVFTINGITYSKEFICPKNGHQIVWVRWHTPSTPQIMTVTASCAMIGMSANIKCNIVELQENVPPDPGYYDTSTALTASVPDHGSNTTTTWGEWSATWVSNWVWSPMDDDYVDEGSWNWSYITYTASLEVDYTLIPDSRCRTATQAGDGHWDMKSGYGVKTDCKVVVTTAGGASSYDTTDVQNVVAVFPEFNYDTYNRLLEYTGLLHGYDCWEFKTNKFSYYNDRVHFTPLWYPDNTRFTVPLDVIDSWTPGGQLYTTTSSYITIDGDMYDDGYIRTLK